jgi:hypothetical protein
MFGEVLLLRHFALNFDLCFNAKEKYPNDKTSFICNKLHQIKKYIKKPSSIHVGNELGK